METITEQELPTKYLRNKQDCDSGKNLYVITNADYVTQLLKTLRMWDVIVLKCLHSIIYPYVMT